MNERIKELAEQAGIEFTYDPTETPMRAFVECWEDEMAKFAELIVSECGEFCVQVDRDAMFIHFGVEDRAITKEMLEQTITRCEQQLAEKRND
jgi:hypothetical protein